MAEKTTKRSKKQADDEAAVREKIAAMPPSYREMGEHPRAHSAQRPGAETASVVRNAGIRERRPSPLLFPFG